MDPNLVTNLFHLGPDAQTTISVLEKVLRPVLVYLFLVVGLRLAGKRELAQLNAFDLVVLLTCRTPSRTPSSARQLGSERPVSIVGPDPAGRSTTSGPLRVRPRRWAASRATPTC